MMGFIKAIWQKLLCRVFGHAPIVEPVWDWSWRQNNVIDEHGIRWYHCRVCGELVSHQEM